MSTVADRVRKHRARREAGKIMMLIEADKHGLPEALIAMGLLPWNKAEDHEGIAQAMTKLLDLIVRKYET